ncbi:MAG: hypothetical protein JJT77_12075 [Crocinitomicaceae bacterium]|nr:hypothetical protein [Crocinitomicaceae bacterium]
MKYFISIITTIVLLAACTKHSNKEVIVTGRLMQSCNSPAANMDGIIRLPGGGFLNKPSTSLEFTTDENGYFKVTHDKSFSQFSVRTSANHSVLDVTSLGGDEKELGEVYINPFPTNFIINLDVKNPYTENDTLFMRDFSSSNPLAEKFILGPFESGVLDSVVNSFYTKFPVKLSDINSHGGPRDAVGVYIKNSSGNYSNLMSSYFYHVPICSDEFAEVTLVIE